MAGLGNIAGALAGAGVGAIASLFGGKKDTPTVTAPNPFGMSQVQSTLSSLSNPANSFAGFSGGGLSGSLVGGNAVVTADPTRSALVGNMSNVYAQQIAKLSDLAAQIAPGASQLRTAQLQDLQNQQTSAVSNLRQNLESRRVLGSSFAQDAVNRTNASFDQQRASTLAQTYQQELDATHQIINEQATAGTNQFDQFLKESNLEAGIAGQLSSQATAAMSAAQKAQADLVAKLASQYTASATSASASNAELEAKAQQGAGNFWGTLAAPVANALSGGVASLFV